MAGFALLLLSLEKKTMKYPFSAVLAALMISASLISDVHGDDAGKEKTMKFTIQPIGHVRKAKGRSTIELKKEYQPGLLGLDGFSHVYVFWWFDRNDTPEKRSILQVHPRGDRGNPLTGVFATRAPVRPNLIALTLCKIVEVKENVVQIDQIDAFAGTPVLDMKPFIPGYDTAPKGKVPRWLKK
jgi:tRNA-Thr(GGU) m(6)t(6)A37 methyltransferase TsaA